MEYSFRSILTGRELKQYLNALQDQEEKHPLILSFLAITKTNRSL